MRYDPARHHRRSIRLKGYDYSRAGAYFVTICTQGRKCVFGNITNGEMVLNDAGHMVEKWYRELQNKFADIRCDEYVIMPNHVHFIVINVGADLCVCPNGFNRIVGSNRPKRSNRTTVGSNRTNQIEHTGGEHAGSALRVVVQWFKTMTTNGYIRGVKHHGWPRFDGKLWQRNYWEHIIRNDDELNRIRQYIINNPVKWEMDRNNPGTSNRVGEPMPEYGHEPWMV